MSVDVGVALCVHAHPCVQADAGFISLSPECALGAHLLHLPLKLMPELSWANAGSGLKKPGC